MSRVGKKSILIPEGVDVEVIAGKEVSVKGKYGELSQSFAGNISVSVDQKSIHVVCLDDEKHTRAMSGTVRSIVNNMVIGVSQKFTKKLNIFGVGYRCNILGKYLNLYLGKSHCTKILIPDHIDIKLEGQGCIIISGINKQMVGEFAALLIMQRKREPYKGKGIYDSQSYLRKKESKKSTK